MNKIIYGILTLICITSIYIISTRSKITNHPNDNTKIIMFGDSLVAGNGSTSGNSLPKQLEGKLGITIGNYGVPGDTTIDGLARVSNVPKDARLVIINLGGNDALQKVAKEETFQHLESIVQHFQKNGAMTMIISVQNGLFGNFDKEYKKIADRTGSLFMTNILRGIITKPSLMADSIHPNDQGYNIIAERIAEIIKKYAN